MIWTGMEGGTVLTNEYVADIRMEDISTGWLKERRTVGSKAMDIG